MSNVDINVDRQTDGRTDGRTENRTPISHPATSRCDNKLNLPNILDNMISKNFYLLTCQSQMKEAKTTIITLSIGTPFLLNILVLKFK